MAIPDIRRFSEWGQTVPSYMPQNILTLYRAPDLLDDTQRKLWSSLFSRLDNAVQALGLVKPSDPRAALGLRYWQDNLALCMLNFPGYTADQLIQCAIGQEFYTPPDEKELQDNKLHADQLQGAIDAGTAFGRVPPGV